MANTMYDTVPWGDMAMLVCGGDCTPIISNQLLMDLIFGKNFKLAQTWAKTFEDMPFPNLDSLTCLDRDNLTRVAQYLSVTYYPKESKEAKACYLDFLKDWFANHWQGQPPDARQLRHMSFSELVNYQQRQGMEQNAENPLSILARLDIKLYLTTSPHRFIETALIAANKHPRTEVYSWGGTALWEKLRTYIPTEYEPDLRTMPTVKEPLVYHLHGIDDCPDSLVLTEDDHLEFLYNIARDIKKPDVIPKVVRDCFAKSLLLLLGYEMYAWDLRVLLQGLIKNEAAFRSARSLGSYAVPVQIIPTGPDDRDQYQVFLEKYFRRISFNLVTQGAQQFLKTLEEECDYRKSLHPKQQAHLTGSPVPQK